jgi:hypothetical protein
MNEAQQGNAGIWSNLGIVVWVAYGFFSGRGQWLDAGIAGLAILALIVTMQYRRRAVKIMDCTSLSYFTAETFLVLAGGVWLIIEYHLVIVWGLFAAVAWTTLIIHFPFTLQYARQTAPREVWDHPLFHRINVRLTEAWAVIFTLGAIECAICLRLGHTLLLGLILPGSGMVFGFVFSNQYPKRFADQFTITEADRAAGSVVRGEGVSC